MKKSPKPLRKLIIQREIVVQLKPPQLLQVVAGDAITFQTAPRCSQK